MFVPTKEVILIETNEKITINVTDFNPHLHKELEAAPAPVKRTVTQPPPEK